MPMIRTLYGLLAIAIADSRGDRVRLTITGHEISVRAAVALVVAEGEHVVCYEIMSDESDVRFAAGLLWEIAVVARRWAAEGWDVASTALKRSRS